MKKSVATLFPTVVVGYQNESHLPMNSKLLNLISKEEFHISNSGIDRTSPNFNYGPEQTMDNHLENREEYSDFFAWVQTCLDDYKNYLQLHTEGLKVVLSWINRGNQYTSHNSHYHQNSYISGVYYISENPSPTYFECPIMAKRTGVSVLSDSVLESNIWASPATAGQLILFPSWLAHYTKSQPFDGNRYTLSLNVMPSGLTNPGTLIECFY